MYKIIILLMLSSLTLESKVCEAPSWDFSWQSDVYEFFEEHPDCDTINGDIYISLSLKSGNEFAIVDLSPFKQIKVITGDLNIAGETDLEDFSGFSNLETIGGDLNLKYIKGIENLRGFESLSVVNNIVYVFSTSVVSLEGLNSLRIIGLWLAISDNKSLVDISALGENIQFTAQTPDYPMIIIAGNENLSVCNTKLLCFQDEDNIMLKIIDNAEGCNSWEEVQDACSQLDVDIKDISRSTYHFISDRQIKVDHPITEGNISIFNTLGKDVTQQAIISNQIIDLQNIEKGFYLLRLDNNIIKLLLD